MNSDQNMLQHVAREAWEFGVGLTPLMPIKVKEGVTVYAKLESFNRFRSVKDRAAFFMIKSALKSGLLDKSKTLIEASSGNTGIAIASIATAMGYDAEIYVPEASSRETRDVLKATGARIIEVSDENSKKGKINIDGALKLVHAKMEEYPDKYVNLNQYANSANTNAHVYTTGPEFISALGTVDAYPDVFVTGVGTGGTVTGMATFLKQSGYRSKVFGAEPDPNHHIQGLKNLTVSTVPEILTERLDFIDSWTEVTDSMAHEGVRRLLEYGYFAGLSSGANFMAALKLSENMSHGSIITVFPDSAEKYRSVLVERNIFSESEYDRLWDSMPNLPEGSIVLSKNEMIRDA